MTSRLRRVWNAILWGRDGPPGTVPPIPAAAAGPLRFANNPELEAKVAAAGDEAAWAIYGDWLLAEGDGRGELLALMGQGLDDQAARWVLRHHDQLFGSVARFTPFLKNKRVPEPFVRYAPAKGDADPIHRQRTRAFHHPTLLRAIEWDHGFVARASLDPATERSILATDLLTQLLRLPICRFLRELGIGAQPNAAEQMPELVPVLEAEAPASLRRLVVGDFVYPDECEMSWATLGDVAPVFRLKQLEALTICGGTAELGGAVDGGHLRAFSRQTGGLAPAELDAIAAGTWTRLERLEVWTGTPNYGGTGTTEQLAGMLVPDRFPALTHLALKNCELSDQLPDLLVRSGLVPRLRALDLSMGTLGPEAAAVLVANAGAFRHLALLQLRDNYLDDGARAAIAQALPQARGLDVQRDAAETDGLRYCSVSE